MDREVTLLDYERNKAFVKAKEEVYQFIKRSFDIIMGILGCAILFPIMIIVKICYVLSGDFDQIIFVQRRIGKDGKEFDFYKFRSMIKNADEVLQELLKDPKYKKEWDLNQKLDHDPRITTIGKILRKTSLDELPQMVNVLAGEMSMIGPRPLIKGELDAHGGNHEIYERVKPGITGWWACNGRSALTYEERLNLEYYYVKNQSLRLDIKCVFRTIKAVLISSGAK